MGVMVIYSAALVISCFFMAWGAVVLTRPFMGILRAGATHDYSNAVVIVWVALGFLQVVGMPFAWWCACLAMSIVSLLAHKPPVSSHGWLMLIAASVGCMILVVGLHAPNYLLTEALLVAAASAAGYVLSLGRRGVSCERAVAIPLAMVLGYVAYSASFPTLMSQGS